MTQTLHSMYQIKSGKQAIIIQSPIMVCPVGLTTTGIVNFCHITSLVFVSGATKCHNGMMHLNVVLGISTDNEINIVKNLVTM